MIERRIKTLLKQRNNPKIMRERQEQLQSLVDVHGLAIVALASGLAESTLKVYLRSKHPQIGYDAVLQATEILNQI